MNPALQTQLFDQLRQAYVQADGGEMFTAAVLWQILVELRIANQLALAAANGQSLLNENLDSLRKDAINELGFTQQG